MNRKLKDEDFGGNAVFQGFFGTMKQEKFWYKRYQNSAYSTAVL